MQRHVDRHGEPVDVDAELSAGQVRWLDPQDHAGENIGDTRTRSIFVELKENRPDRPSTTSATLGPRAD